MRYLIVVNSFLSPKTARFWVKNESTIKQQLPDSDVYLPESRLPRLNVDIKSIKTIVLVGSDSFVNQMVNCFYPLLNTDPENTPIAIIPHDKNSSLASGLGLPNSLQYQLELIRKNQSVYLDVARCHFFDRRGLPSNRLILNDALIGIPNSKLPLFFKTISQLASSPSFLPFRKPKKAITLISGNSILYQGDFIFSLILLGNKVTNGPTVRNNPRVNRLKFDYLQMNSSRPKDITALLLKALFTEFVEGENSNLIQLRVAEISIKGKGGDMSIIADGLHIGQLPATFSLLPKALKVVSPRITVRLKKSWKRDASPVSLPKPAGSRNGLREQLERESTSFDRW